MHFTLPSSCFKKVVINTPSSPKKRLRWSQGYVFFIGSGLPFRGINTQAPSTCLLKGHLGSPVSRENGPETPLRGIYRRRVLKDAEWWYEQPQTYTRVTASGLRRSDQQVTEGLQKHLTILCMWSRAIVFFSFLVYRKESEFSVRD